MSQYLGVNYFVSAEYKHSFFGRLSGGYSNEIHTFTLNHVKYQVEKNANRALTKDFGFTIDFRAAMFLGVEGGISIGVRNKN